jgi:aryl-alcohol dehydrogenase-like predicted oxidoreductase
LSASEFDVKNILARAKQRLGFGCGQLYGGRTRKDSMRLLETAIDSGITYFDTARLYGNGEAEYLLGELMPRHRDKVVLASKGGILPRRNSLSKRIYDKASRIARKVPTLQRFIPKPVPAEPTFGVFGVADLRRSVETSLRALRTDHLDIFLLHECGFDNATDPDVIELLESLENEGKIRGWGTATSLEATAALAQANSVRISLFQFPSNAWCRNVDKIRSLTKAPLITHSVLGASFGSLVVALREDPRVRAKAMALDVDPDDGPALAERLVADAIQANPDGVVLFSTSKIEHILSNLTAKHMAPEKVSAAIELVEYFKFLGL